MNEIDGSVDVRPTLVIGLGGTGHEVLVRFKALLLESFGEDIFSIVKLLAIDTADQSITAGSRTGGTVRLDRDTEFINIGHVPVQRALKNIDQSPSIRSWLPDSLPVRAITAGAKQIRGLGRLALLFHYHTVKPVLEQALRSLLNIKLQGPVGERACVRTSRGLNIFVVSSICGGTGSGIFLDIAYLTRELAAYQGLAEEFCSITGMLVLPGAFSMVASDAIMANAYAALRELNYFSSGGFTVEYPDGLRVDPHWRPFNTCYLVDANNELGRELTGLEDLSPMIAEALFLQIASQVGPVFSSVLDNIKSLSYEATGPDGRAWPTSFSSLGLAVLGFPAASIIDKCAYRLSYNFVRSGLLRPADESRAEDASRGFAEKHGLLPGALVVALSEDSDGRTMRPRLGINSEIKAGQSDFLARLDKTLSDYDRYVLGDLEEAVGQAAERVKKVVSQAIVQEIQSLVDDPQCGPLFARSFLRQLSANLERLAAAFSGERISITESRARTAPQQDVLRQALDRQLTSFPVGRGMRVANALEHYVEAREADFTATFDIAVRDSALQLLGALSKVLEQQVANVSTLISRLESLLEQFQRDADEPLLEEALPFWKTVITADQDVDTYYLRYLPNLGEELVRFLSQFGTLSNWHERRLVELSHDLLEFARQPYMPVSNERIEHLLETKATPINLEEWLRDLRDDASPFLTLSLARQGQVELETVTVVGVENKTQSIFRNYTQKGEILVSTRDPHQISVLCTRHGLPLFALSELEYWERKYREHIARDVSPLHVFSGLPWMETGKEWFALSLAFGLIRRVGVWYYFYTEPNETRLGQGLLAARSQFLGDEQLVSKATALIEEEVKRLGSEQAARLALLFTTQPLSRDTEVARIETELYEAVRGFVRGMGYSTEKTESLQKEVEQYRLLVSRIRQFFERAGFEVATTEEMESFVCRPTGPTWQWKLRGKVYTTIVRGKALHGDNVRNVRRAALTVSSECKIAFALVDQRVHDDAWLQIAAFRAEGFNVIPIPLAALDEIGSAALPGAEEKVMDAHLQRFLGRGYDPYDVRDPVSDVLSFFGREALSGELIDRLMRGRAIGLFGLRKIGKSSVLKYARSLMPCPTAWLDLQAGWDLAELYERILRAWEEDAQARFRVDLDLRGRALIAWDSALVFPEAVLQMIDRLAASGMEARLAIFLDEIDLLLPPADANSPALQNALSIMRTLRGFIQEDGRIMLMVAGVDPAVNRTSRLGERQEQNPFYQFLQEVYVPPLMLPDCVQMIRNIGQQVGVLYTDDASEHIASASGGHPFLARQLSSLTYILRDLQPGEVSLEDAKKASERFRVDPQYAAFLGDTGLWHEVSDPRLWTNHASRANQKVLLTLARSAEPLPLSRIACGADANELKSAVFALEQLSVIRAEEGVRGDGERHYSIAFEVFHSWIRRIKLGLDE